jgi:L-serine dehydratase
LGIFDIIGPVMVGPSSSHTAGAVRIGAFARLVLGTEPAKALVQLHGSFAATGEGHGTPLALLAGLLGLAPDDERIPAAEALAAERGLEYRFEEVDLGDDAHPNSVRLFLEAGGAPLELSASSVGGGRIAVFDIDGFDVDLAGAYPTILLTYPDRPGAVAVVSAILANATLNIATIKAHRNSRGGQALMTVELDTAPPPHVLETLRCLPQFEQVRFIPSLGFGG